MTQSARVTSARLLRPGIVLYAALLLVAAATAVFFLFAVQPTTSATPRRSPRRPTVVDPETLRKARLRAEVVLRLKGTDLAADAETKAMVDKALDSNRGLPAFAEIVEAFAIRDRDAELLQLAIEHAADSTGALAMRLVLAHDGTPAVQQALAGDDGPEVAQALGNANDQRALALLAPIVADGTHDRDLQLATVRALGQFEAGAKALLARYKDNKLPAELAALAASVLANAPWDDVRAAVQQSLPAPETADGKLPPIAELAKLSGDAAHGEQVFSSLCLGCHQVAGKGVDYGPNLGEIGSKLGKDGLYLAVVYPDAGVEVNFETTVLAFANGNSAIGIVVSDTADEIAIKSIGGIVSRYRTADVVRRSTQKTSSMPPNLQRNLHQQDLVDLIEYLASLKKR
jgi:putative heme-binding domain-containing protein